MNLIDWGRTKTDERSWLMKKFDWQRKWWRELIDKESDEESWLTKKVWTDIQTRLFSCWVAIAIEKQNIRKDKLKDKIRVSVRRVQHMTPTSPYRCKSESRTVNKLYQLPTGPLWRIACFCWSQLHQVATEKPDCLHQLCSHGLKTIGN